MGWCTAQCKMLFSVKTIMKESQFWTSPSGDKEEEEEKHFGRLAMFIFATFTTFFHATRSLAGHETLKDE